MKLIDAILIIIIIVLLFMVLTGCSGTGFNKETTLVPDSVGISFSQARYREEDAAYRGFTINAQWNLK